MKLLIPPPLVGLITGIAMWFLAGAFPRLSISIPSQQEVAMVIIAIGVSIDLVAIRAFWKAKTTVTPLKPEKASKLVFNGIYQFTRNPMYLGMFVILVGLTIWFGSLFNIVMLLFFIVYITNFQIKPEEEKLEEIFGEDFAIYKRRVRRWL